MDATSKPPAAATIHFTLGFFRGGGSIPDTLGCCRYVAGLEQTGGQHRRVKPPAYLWRRLNI